jgi:cytochrome c peroxidase
VRQAFYFLIVFLLSLQMAAAADRRPIPAQAERGRELFSDSPKGTACATCHSMAGLGTAVGPDLSTLASVVGARGIASAIRMTVTEYVLEVKTSAGVFPGIEKRKQGDEIEVWDLSQTPPALRKLASKQIISTKQNQNLGGHPKPASSGHLETGQLKP